ADAWNNKGNLLRDLGRLDEAFIAIEHATLLNPHNPGFWFNKGLILFGLARYQEAVVSFDRALANNQQYVACLLFKGRALRELNRLQEAVNALEHATQLDFSLEDAWLELKSLYLQLDMRREFRAVEELLSRATFTEDGSILLNPPGDED